MVLVGLNGVSRDRKIFLVKEENELLPKLWVLVDIRMR